MQSEDQSTVVQQVDLSSWKRREHFEFFRQYEQPFFNICSEVDVTTLNEFVRDTGCSFFLASLYLSLKAANEIEEMRLRIRDENVVLHPLIHAGSTVLREDETFAFGYFDYKTDFDAFQSNGRKVLAEVANPTAIRPHTENDNLIFYSVLPWISFTSFAHAVRSPTTECIPRIVFGKRSASPGGYKMPISVDVHHALVDGLHVGRYLERFQQLLLDPGPSLSA